MKKFAVFISLFVLLLIPALAFSVEDPGLDESGGGIFGTGDVAVFVGNVIRGALGIVGVIILILMVYGGYLWMVSSGNEQMVRKAKDILINATIGLIVVLAAYAITTFVVGSIYSAITSSGSNTQKTCSEFGTSYACMNEVDGHSCGDASDCSSPQKCCIPFNTGG